MSAEPAELAAYFDDLLSPHQAGLFAGIDFELYKALPAANAHGLGTIIDRSPFHFEFERRNPAEPSPSMLVGSAFHCLVLTPELFDSEVAVSPVFNRRSNAGKAEAAAWEAANAGKVWIDEEQQKTIRNMAQAIRNDPVAPLLLADGTPELTGLWYDPETGVRCKLRMDYWSEPHGLIIDLKSAQDASWKGAQRAIGNFGYHRQAAWYLRGAKLCGMDPAGFVFCFAESSPPYGVSLWELDAQAIQAGRVQNRRALATYAECLASDIWPSYPPGVQAMQLKPWQL